MTLRKKQPSPRRTPGVSARLPNTPHQASRLVGLGFRCWLAGYETHDVDCWETGWNVYARELGPTHAKAAIGELSCWVRTIHCTTCRRIETYPFGCAGFCQDECMAISMIAASQHSACPAMRACAFALLGTSEIDGVVDTATSFGNLLRDSGHLLSDSAICDATAVASSCTNDANRIEH